MANFVFNIDPSTSSLNTSSVVVRTGLIFECGAYPDKQFSLTEQEADAAIASFQPASLDVEHIPTVFDGLLGHVRKIWRTGRQIFAEYAFPKPLNDLLEGKPVKVSAQWDTLAGGRKCLTKCALVVEPRVRNAVAACFANTMKTDTPAEKKRAITFKRGQAVTELDAALDALTLAAVAFQAAAKFSEETGQYAGIYADARSICENTKTNLRKITERLDAFDQREAEATAKFHAGPSQESQVLQATVAGLRSTLGNLL